MTSLNSKLQLAVLNRKKGRNLLEKGFTLVELMIVIVIVGILSAVALPNFLGTKDKAEAGSTIGSLVGLAKQCSLNAIQENDDELPVTEVVLNAAANNTETDGVELAELTADTNCDGGGELSNIKAFDGTKIGEIKCVSAVNDPKRTAPYTTCTVSVDSDGVISGAWS